MLLTRIEIDHETAIIIPRVLIMHALLDVDIHAADRIDELRERLGIHNDIVIHRHAEQLLHRLL